VEHGIDRRGEVTITKQALRLRAEVDARVPRTAMVMAAGLGKRMRPLTASRPKPLVEVAGKPLLDHVLDRLRCAGVEHVVVNVHYLPDALEAHLRTHADGLEVSISDERALLLETGGGLVKAAPLIDCDPFLAVNSDNLWVDGPADTLKLLASQWDGARMDALLLLVPQARAENHKGLGDFHMDRSGRLRRRDRSRVAPYVYTGIQIIAKSLLTDAPDGPFSTNLFWDRAIEAGRCFGAVHQGLWFDVGTPDSIRTTEQVLASG
jgi:MurNAc alpha-1-phosphate uridylyltransferase